MDATIRDHLGRPVRFRRPPRRIVSLCPSLTETLAMLGAADRLVGRTRYCTRPADAVEHAAIVGGVYDIDPDVIDRLDPDLILASREENRRTPIEALAARRPVLVTDVRSVDDARRLVRDLGTLVGATVEAERLANTIATSFDELEPIEPPQRAACIVWNDPLMAVSDGTYIGDLMQRAGLVNVFAGTSEAYPVVSIDDLAGVRPDVLLLPDEPHAFGRAEAQQFQRTLPQTRSFVVDGQMLAWYGGRSVHAAAFLRKLLAEIVPGCEALRQPG